jgi:hypothetical protein
MGPETSLVGSCAQNHLCTYDLYSPVHNILDTRISITWASGRGWALEFKGPKKLSNSRAQPPPACPCNGYTRIQNIMHGAI